MDHKLRKVVYMSLAGLLLAVLLFMFGITISHNSLFVDGVYYILTLALLIITLIMLKNNRKLYKKALLSYLMGIDVFFIVLHMDKRLFRSKKDRMIGGVCGGLAEYLNIDPAIVRIVAALLMLTWGTGILLYIIMWIVIPEEV